MDTPRDKRPTRRPGKQASPPRPPLGTIRQSEFDKALRDPENIRTLAEARRIFKESSGS